MSINPRQLPAILAPLIALLFLLAGLGSAVAQDIDHGIELDRLFAQLSLARDATEANRIDQQIWALWSNPTDPVLADRIAEVLAARTSMNLPGALELATALVNDYPNYAEGWNQRATLNFMLGQYDASLADIDKTLALEPRHFGALSGQSMIYLQLGKRDRALQAIRAALAVHPFLAERQMFPELIQDITRI